MQRFQPSAMGNAETLAKGDPMLCRGCAAKLPAATLEAALSTAGVSGLAAAPEDAAVVPSEAQDQGTTLLQSVDGFPALVSDPWLNGLLTMHLLRLWACGVACGRRSGGHPALAPAGIQQYLLAQTMLVSARPWPTASCPVSGRPGGRNPASDPFSLGLQLALSGKAHPAATSGQSADSSG